jgi:MYXO-CTERM domain-containing protein
VSIYNWGFRNPWRFSFDRATGYLWIGDVGEVTFEEITVSTGPAQHHGWPYREGGGAEGGLPIISCASSTRLSGNCKEPAFAYPHDEAPAAGAGSVTGGVFTHHCSWPEAYRGLYWFGDYNKSRVWTLTPNAARDGVVSGSRRTIVLSVGATHFTTGPDGALYVGEVAGGAVWRVAPTNPVNCVEPDGGSGFDLGIGPRTDAGAQDGGTEPADEEGCSCRGTRPEDAPHELTGLLLGALALIGLRLQRKGARS